MHIVALVIKNEVLIFPIKKNDLNPITLQGVTVFSMKFCTNNSPPPTPLK